MRVEQVDRDALEAAYAKQWGAPMHTVYSDDHWLAKAFAAHRIAAEQHGREQERAAIVAWLRSDACIWMVGGDIANEIEAEEHLK